MAPHDFKPPTRWATLFLATVMASASVLAQGSPPTPMQVSIWAYSCMACHGPDGRAEGTGLSIAGRPEEDLTAKLLGYKSGKLNATIMHQHTKGYSDDELRAISRFFANLK